MSSGQDYPDSSRPAEEAKGVRPKPKKSGRKSLRAQHDERRGHHPHAAEAPVTPAPEATAAWKEEAEDAPEDQSAAAAPAGGLTRVHRDSEFVGDRPLFTKAVLQFLRRTTVFESSIPIDEAMLEISKAVKLNEVFLIPMRHKILNMDGCLRFALFLFVLGSKPIEEEAPFTGSAKFAVATAMKAIDACFDEGIQGAVWDVLDEALEEDESGESGSEPDE